MLGAFFCFMKLDWKLLIEANLRKYLTLGIILIPFLMIFYPAYIFRND